MKRQTVHILRLLVVAVAFLASAVSSYAQKPDAPPTDENKIRYRYTEKDIRTIRFSSPQSILDRMYFYAGTGVEGLYQIGNHPQSPGHAIGSNIGAGIMATPIHGAELALTYGMMPYGYWGENFLGNPVIDNTIIKHIGLEAKYVLNLTNLTYRHDKTNSFDILYTAGASFRTGDKFFYDVNTSFRAVYNIGVNAGLYIEPKVNLTNLEYIRPSVSAGFMFRIKNDTQGYEKPVDKENKKLLFALKSNTLFWIAGAPNFGIEIPVAERWSVCADYVAPWNSSFATGLYYQLMMINAEGRYWFDAKKDKPQMTGWFAGLYAGGGYYDLMLTNEKQGFQGEFYIMAGASAGYAHSISTNDRIRLEYSLGLGYMQTRYRKYHWDDFDYVLDAPREQLWKTSIFGPTQAKVSLVWLLYVNKKGGER